MKIGKIGRFTISRIGETIANGGDGASWWCTCPEGVPMPKCRPCNHKFSLFSAAKKGKVTRRITLTPEGEAAAAECECISEARANGAGEEAETPPTPPTPPGAREGHSMGGPCPCGSGRKFKKCEGTADAPHARFAFGDKQDASKEEQDRQKELRRQQSLREEEQRDEEDFDGGGEAEDEAEDAKRAEDAAAEAKETARLRRAERRVEREETKVRENARIDAILDRVRAIDEARRDRRNAAARARREAKKAATP
jgi:hypothetical protein